jgi:hypothetical protein
MAGILSICKVTVGAAAAAKDYYFQGSSSYAGLEAETGVTIVKAADWKNQEPLIPIGNLIEAAKVDRKTVRYLTTDGKTRKSTTLIFAKDKVSAAEESTSAIIGKDYKVNGVSKGKILKVGNSRTKKNKY